VKVVIDTNVFISGLIKPAGPPGRVVDLVVSGAVDLVLSKWIQGEFVRVLGYERVTKAADPATKRIPKVQALLIRRSAEEVEEAGFVRDPDDRHVLGAALHLDADLIIIWRRGSPCFAVV